MDTSVEQIVSGAVKGKIPKVGIDVFGFDDFVWCR